MLPSRSEVEVKRVTDQMAILKGNRSILKDYLVEALASSGWEDRVRLWCREEIAKQNGLISVDSLVDKVTPKARKDIPESIKAEMVAKIKQVLLQAE